MKGTLFAKPTFVRKNIRQPTLISIRPLVAYDEHRLFFGQTSIKWTYKDIVNCTFLPGSQVLLVLTDDYKIYVFTPLLERITVLHNWDPKFIVGFEALEPLGLLLLVGTEEIELMKITVLTNVRRTKFLSSMKFSIRKEEHLAVEPQACLKWNRGYGYDLGEDLLYVWSTLDIHFFSLGRLALRSRIAGLAKKENSLSIVLYSSHYKYTVTGMLNGDVRVWRLPTSELYHHKEILIHNFSYHTREIEHIIPGADHRTLITAGLDMYVCFISLETFELLRAYNFSGEYSKIYLCSPTLAYAVKDSYLGHLNFGIDLEFMAQLTGQPLTHHHASSLVVTLSSNVGLELKPDEVAEAPEVNKVGIRYHYPPLKSKVPLALLRTSARS
jgi:WD40 repeat protein